MPAYKDERILKSGKKKVSWTSRFYCNGKQIKKRGFKTKKEAIEFEINYINQNNGNPEMKFSDFYILFCNDKEKKTSKRST